MHRAIALIPLATLAACSDARLAGMEPFIKLDNEVNHAIQYTPDTGDIWDTSCPPKGDCEDYAFCKAKGFMQAGANPADLRVVVVTRKNQSAHAVLIHRDVVFDNTSWPQHQDQIKGYTPIYACRMDGKQEVYIKGNLPGRQHLFGYSVIQTNPTGKCAQALQSIKEQHHAQR